MPSVVGSEFEHEVAEFGAVPHWGQYNALGRGPDRLAKLYPRWQDWLRVYERFNSSGVFDSAFTDRLGISKGGAR